MFTNPEGRVTLEIQENTDNYLVSIRDTGIGIDEKDFEKIFEKFGQV